MTIAVLGLVEVCLLIGIGLVVLQMANVNLPTPPAFASVTLATRTPLPACLHPTLTIGSTRFLVQTIQRSINGNVSISSDIPGKAFWVEGTSNNLVFGLSYFPEVKTWQTSLKTGDPIHIVWADCSEDDYVVKTIDAGQQDPEVLFDQSNPGIRVFVQTSQSLIGFMIQGVKPIPMTGALARCDGPALRIGPLQFRLLPVEPAADGSFSTLAPTSGAANWYQGAAAEYVLSIGPTAENLDLGRSLKPGYVVTITRDNCEVTTYTVSKIDHGVAYTPTRSKKPAGGVILFVQNADPGTGFIVAGGPVTEQLDHPPTPPPGRPVVKMEVSLLETSTSADRTTLSVRMAIRNRGVDGFKVSSGDVQLTPQGARPLKLVSAKPALPVMIEPGITKVITFTFHKPSSRQAVIKVFSVENNLDGY
jgi:hypothetical protein